MAEVYNWEEKRGGLMCGYNHCLQINSREFHLITKALMGYAETEIEYEEIHAAVTLIKDMEENSTKVDSNPIVIREDDPDDTDYCNNDCEHCEWATCPKETFRKVFEVDDDVKVIIKVPSEKYDPSKSVWENIREGNGISREITDALSEGSDES